MAKRKPQLKLGSWSEVDDALKELGTNRQFLTEAEADMNAEIEQVKTEYAEKAAPALARNKELERAVEKFAEAHRNDFGGARSKTLMFGVVRFRTSARLIIHNTKNTLAAIRALLGRTAEKYIKVKETLDRNAMSELPDDTLSTIGVTRKTGEAFGYEINWENIRSS